jgi:hypothetical protein
MAQGLIYNGPAEKEDPEWVLCLKLDQYTTPRVMQASMCSLITNECTGNWLFIDTSLFDGKITFSLHTPKICVLLTIIGQKPLFPLQSGPLTSETFCSSL